MEVPRLPIDRILLPIAPFVAVIIAPNLVFLDASSHIENRPTKVTIRSADGHSIAESKQKDVTMVHLRWRLGPYPLSSSTRTASVFQLETGSSNLEIAADVFLLQMRSWVALGVFTIALIASFLIGRVLHWHSLATVLVGRSYPPLQTVSACLCIFVALVIGFVLMKSWWPPGTRELAAWFRLSVSGIIPFTAMVIVAPVTEELVFRSGVCRILVERIGPSVGILFQAIIFGCVHLATPLHMAVGFAGGVVLGTVYVYCRSLNASIFLHAGANGVVAVACRVLA